MANTKFDVKQQFVWKRDVWRRKVEEFLDAACYGASAEDRAKRAAELYTLFDMHTEIANASLLEVLQAAAEVGFAMSAQFAPVVTGTLDASDVATGAQEG
jgi:hypothetical protein